MESSDTPPYPNLSPPISPITPDQTPPKTKIIPFILISIVGLLVVAGIIMAKSFMKKPFIPSGSSIKTDISPEPTYTQTNTDNMKTYRAGKTLTDIGIDFSIQYPDNWYANEENPLHTSGVPWVIFSQNPVEDVTVRDSPCFSIGGGIWPSSITMEDFIQDQSLNNPDIPVISTEDININELSGIKRKVLKNMESRPTWQVFLRGRANGVENINYFILESCPGTTDAVFDLIISAFQPLSLTNPGQTNETTDWKMYNNNYVPFIFKFPPEMSYFVQNSAEPTGLKNILIQIQNFDNNKPFPSDFNVNGNYFNLWIRGAATGADFQSVLDDSDLGLSQSGREKVNIDGIEGWKGTGIIHNQPGIVKVMFQYKDWIFSITGQPTNSKYFAWFDQILSTFQFIE